MTFCDSVTSSMTKRASARTGESLGIKAVALAVPVDR